MNVFSNIWNHPKTSAVGLLIAVVSIAGVLSQQGITLGNAGSGSVITLVSALASALLGLLAKDPSEAPPSSGSTAKLGAWALIALLLPLPYLGGCSQAIVARNIVNWTPALQSAVATVHSAGALLAPTDAQVIADFLQAARIVNPASQQHGLETIQAVGTIVTAILALVQSVSNKAAVAQMAARSTIKMAAVRPYLNETQAAEIVAGHYGEPVAMARMQVAHAELHEVPAGF